MPRADRLSPDAVKLLQEKQIAHVATVMRDGSPQVTPVWVDVEPDGSHVLINTAEGRIKANNLMRDPRIAISVVDAENPYRAVAVRGTIVERRNEQEGAAEHINKLARKYRGDDTYRRRASGERRIMLRIKPTHVMERGLDR